MEERKCECFWRRRFSSRLPFLRHSALRWRKSTYAAATCPAFGLCLPVQQPVIGMGLERAIIGVALGAVRQLLLKIRELA